jgi:hypothetical protein
MSNFKLFNPIEDPFLSELRFRMGARLLSRQVRGLLPPLIDPEAMRALGREGILLDDLEELTKESDRTLSYKGQRVVVYIRDQHKVREDQGLPKFHISFCGTLDTMQRNQRWHRYVIANPDNETFIINWISDPITTISERLDVCQTCLDNLMWDNFILRMPKSTRHSIVSNFRLIDFFAKYPKDLMSVLPAHNVDTAPINDYSDDFEQIRQRIIKERGYSCDACRLDLTSESNWLHLHHENANKADNSPSNLTLFCYDCHANQPYHSHMKGISRHSDFIKKYGSRHALAKNLFSPTEY